MDSGTVELVLANRAFLYGVIARAFAEEPDEGFAEIVCSGHTRDEAALVDDEFLPGVTGALEAMAGCLNDMGVAELRLGYAKLFVGPGVLHCSPWETMHTTGKRVLFQAGILDVRNAYKEAGFLPARYPAVADDFIGLECDFLAKLARDACDAHRERDTARLVLRLAQSRSFLSEHLLKWIDGLADGIDRQRGSEFYVAAAHMAGCIGRRDLGLTLALEKDAGAL